MATRRSNVDAKAYHLVLTPASHESDSKPHDVAYRRTAQRVARRRLLVLPAKVRGTGLEGLRDMVYKLNHERIREGGLSEPRKNRKRATSSKDSAKARSSRDHLPLFFGVDAQYFSAVMLPDREPSGPGHRSCVALRMGEIEEQRKTLTKRSFRMIGKPLTMAANVGKSRAAYELFAGPKRPNSWKTTASRTYDLLRLDDLQWVAVPMTHILDFFYRWCETTAGDHHAHDRASDWRCSP